MKRVQRITGLLLSILVTIGAPVLAWRAASSLLTWFVSQESQVAAALIAAAASVLAGVGAVIVAQQRSKTREIAETHRPRKVELYTKFIKRAMQEVWKHAEVASPGGDPEAPSLQEFFREFTTDLVLWGSPGVIRAYGRFRAASEDDSAQDTLVAVDDLMRAMRKDLGHSDLMLNRGELIKIFLRDPQELDKLL